MRVYITTVGSHGDVNPFIAVGRALAARGHEVEFFVQPYFEPMVRGAGLTYRPMGQFLDLKSIADNPQMMGAWTGSAHILKDFIFPHIPEAVRTLEGAIDRARPDLVLTHHICMGPAWVCAREGIPWAVACLTPLMWTNPEDLGVYMPLVPDTPRPWMMRLQHWLLRIGSRRQYDPGLNAARRELGFPQAEGLFVRDLREGFVNLGLWSPHFRGPFPGDPENGRICGFPVYDRAGEHEHAPDEIERFLEECDRRNDPPVVFTLGSTAVHVAGHFYEAAAGACRLTGRRGLLLTGRPEYAPTHLPSAVRAFNYAPHSAVMPRGAASVHHGGVGTTAQGLRSGRPTVIVPFAHDQFDNAARTVRLGVSATVKRNDISAESLAEALRRVLDHPSVALRAAKLGRAISAEDGAEAAATELERAVRPGQPLAGGLE